ncbi:MAG TPA: alpha/beta hydrolase [Alloacidobacterium sp.]|nr:alpha/beta hydrolase [Alloacidobacterium sp.]
MALATWMLVDGPQINERDITVDQYRVHFLKTGSGPHLVLLHGLLGTADAWRPCLPRLAEDSTVYAVDSLGIGFSERVPGLDAALCAQADRVALFLEKADIEKADIVGTSHGGAAAMMLAARHPERVRSLALHAPANPFSTISDPLVHFYRSPLGRWFARQVPYLPEKVQELALGRMYGDSSVQCQEILDRYMTSLRVPGTVAHVMNILDCWFEDMRKLQGILDRIAQIPTLLLWGTLDRAVSLESGYILQKKLQAEMVILPGVGHLPYDEAPLAFADAVNGFLQKIDRYATRPRPQLVTPSRV